MATNNCINGARSGTVVGYTYATTNAHFMTTATVNTNGTPTTANTASLMSISYSAQNASNTLVFSGLFVNKSNINGGNGTFFLFVGSTCIAAFSAVGDLVGASAPVYSSLKMLYSVAAGTTSSTTYTIRWARRSAAGIFCVNTNSSNDDLYQNTVNAVFSITEILS